MSITVRYRGTLADPERVEDFEDRVVDVALELGGLVRVWRSVDDDRPQRMVRGLIVELSPGQEATSLLLSPEGWLIPSYEVEAAQQATLREPPWCAVDTLFGAVDGHAALIELLATLKNDFFPDLEVSDESGHWEDRDLAALIRKFAQLQAGIDGLAEWLQRGPLDCGAVDKPAPAEARLRRLAQLVQRTLTRPPEHPPVLFEDGDLDEWNESSESQWDAAFKEERRKQERLNRAIEERMRLGDDHHDAFENAMRDEGIIDLPGEEPNPEVLEELAELEDAARDEPWKASLPETAWSDDDAEFDDGLGEDAVSEAAFDRDEDPLQERAMEFNVRIHGLFNDVGDRETSHISTLMGGAGDMMGGLAQALGPGSQLDGLDRGWSLVQLKRALRGAAFARGALFPLRELGLIGRPVFDELSTALADLESGIRSEIATIRGRL